MSSERASEAAFEMHEIWHSEGGLLDKPKGIGGQQEEGVVPNHILRNGCCPG